MAIWSKPFWPPIPPQDRGPRTMKEAFVMGEDRCETCRFIGRQSKTKPILFACRRFPPTVLTVVENRDFRKDHYKAITVWSETTSDVSLWPMTTRDDWCGEHTPKGPLT